VLAVVIVAASTLFVIGAVIMVGIALAAIVALIRMK
jgi:hypothetical protein